MRYVFGFLCVCALGVAPLVGCTDEGGTGGSGGTGGTDLCEGVSCEDTECKTEGVCDPTDGICDYGEFVADGTACSEGECLDGVCARVGAFPCTEQGIRAAIAEGGGPHTFDCDGPQRVNLEGEIVIDNDVILDGEGNLTVVGYGHYPQRVFSVPKGVKAELRRLTATGGYGGIANEGTLAIQNCVISENWAEFGDPWAGGGILNEGEMTIINSSISKNTHDHGLGGGIYNGCSATLTLVNCTISGNNGGADGSGPIGGGIFNAGEMTIINSTVSDNRASGFFDIYGGGIFNSGWMSLTNSTVSGNVADLGGAIGTGPSSCADPYAEIANTLIDGDCAHWFEEGILVSNGDNIESPGDTCGFNQTGDQVNITDGQLDLDELAANGGPTMTHALGADSVAIDVIPEEDCVDADGLPLTTDQRGEPRDSLCDVGAFEVQP